jgi:hypothetical protein
MPEHLKPTKEHPSSTKRIIFQIIENCNLTIRQIKKRATTDRSPRRQSKKEGQRGELAFF